jgi:hypothetical protein
MKKYLLLCLCLVSISSVSLAQFTNADTVKFLTNSDSSAFFARITNTSSGNVTIIWHVAASDFPSDWRDALGICDNKICYYNGSGALWNGSLGPSFKSAPYAPGGGGDFHMLNSFSGVSAGTHWLTVNLKDSASSFNKNTTFVVTNWAAGVITVTKTSDEVVLYPIPATDQLNVLFNADAGIKTAVIYNLIGQVTNVYKVNGSSAGLDIQKLPSGVYFLKLMNAQGGVLATRKFTKQ